MARASGSMSNTSLPNSFPYRTRARIQSGMISSTRLRRGGSSKATTFRRKNRSSRNAPSATSFLRSRLVADTTRSILDKVENCQSKRVVIDSLSELRMLAQEPIRHSDILLRMNVYHPRRAVRPGRWRRGVAGLAGGLPEAGGARDQPGSGRVCTNR